MAESIIQKAGGGAASDECTAGKAQVLAGYTAVTKDSGDEPAVGTMAANGSMDASLNCGQSRKIPAGYTPGGTVTANSLASQTGGATAEDKYVLNGKTYWKDGVLHKGAMTVASVASFSVAPYSTSQVLATWKNPSRGPYSGVAICAKAGGYPVNINDGRVYTGVGSNSAVNGTSSQVISGLAAGTTYYFRIWVYCTCSAGDQYSGYLQATCKVTAHGRQAFTASGTFTVPAGVRSVNIHCTGGGGGGFRAADTSYYPSAGYGGGGGYTAYKNNYSVSPGQSVSIIVGSGGRAGVISSPSATIGGTSSVLIGGVTIISALGGNQDKNGKITINQMSPGGSAGGRCAWFMHYAEHYPAQAGASDGGSTYSQGQGSSTKEFGTGTLYGGGGGGGGCSGPINQSDSAQRYGGYNGASGGAGGGGAGGGANAQWNATTLSKALAITDGISGSAGTGGGGGGASARERTESNAGNGGSGNVIITW